MDSQATAIGTSHHRHPLRLELFGGPALWQDGRSIRVSPLQTGLLALAFADGTARMRRLEVQQLLWKSHDDRALRHRLSQLVYQTNQTAGTRIFEPDGEYIRVHHEIVNCDIDEYSAMVRSGDFGEACDTLDRGFLSACSHRKTSAFADWIEERRVFQRSQLRATALSVWEKAENAHDWARAQVAADVLLRLEPREETILRRVMRARVMAGQVREAEAVYRSFAERIDPSGSWTPEPATKRLLKNVKDAHKRSTRRTDEATDRPPDPPLVGRSEEIAQLTRNLYRNGDGRRWRTIIVRGEAGVGKTRLVHEVIKSARFRGYHVMEACAVPLERTIALGPLLETLSEPSVLPFLRALAEPWRSTMLALLPEFQEGSKRFSSSAPPQVGTLSRHTCEAILRLFATIAEAQKTILFLDGFHWADDGSIAVLQFLHRRWGKGDLTLLVAYCEEELRRDDNVTRFIREEELDSGTVTVRLRELDDAAAVELARSVVSVDDTCDSSLVGITRTAGGNPRFLLDLAASSEGHVAGGDIPERIPVPVSVRQVIARRFERLDHSSRKVADSLAVLGRSTPVDRLVGVTDTGRTDCLDALENLHRLRLIHWSSQGVRFRHALFGHAVYERIHPSRRTVLHARTAEVLSRTSNGTGLLDVARHYHLAGRRRHASMCALEAVKYADSRNGADRLGILKAAYELSEGPRRGLIAASLSRAYYDLRRLRPTVRFGAKALDDATCLSPSEALEVRLAVADARHLLGLDDVETSLAGLLDMEESARTIDDDTRLAAVLDTRVQVLDRAGRRDELIAELARIREMEPSAQPLGRCRVLATLAMEAEYVDPEAGLRSGREAVRLARSSESRHEGVLAHQRCAVAFMTSGLVATPEGWEMLSTARTSAEESGQLGCQAFVLLGLAEWHTATGDHEVATRVLQEARQVTREMDCPQIRTMERLVRGNLAVVHGDLDEMAAVLAAIDGAEGDETDGDDADPVAVPVKFVDPLAGLAGTLLMELGKLRRLSAIAEMHPAREPLCQTALGLILFHTRLRARTGDLTGARALLERSLDANESRRPLVWLRLSLETVRLARRTGKPEPALAERARGRAKELGLTGLAHEFLPFCDD